MFYRLLESLTFQQQRHEGDVRRTQLGHRQSVGPVVAWRILHWVQGEKLSIAWRCGGMRPEMEPERDPSPSAARRRSRSFWSCWGFSANIMSMESETTLGTVNVRSCCSTEASLTSQVLWSLCTALLPKPNITAKNELRFFCSFRLSKGGYD